MAGLDRQLASNFYFTLDNYTAFSPNNVPQDRIAQSKALKSAYISVFQSLRGEPGIYGTFRKSYEKDPTLADFTSMMLQFKAQLLLIQNDTEQFIRETLCTQTEIPMEQAVQEAFEFFGQGVLFDERRNNASYNFWSIHAMDSTYPSNPPIGYYIWYIFVRSYGLVGGTGDFPLSFARSITIGAAVQNFMKPKGASGPTKTNPNNPAIDPGDLQRIRDEFKDLSFEQMDELYATATVDSPIGPPPLPMR